MKLWMTHQQLKDHWHLPCLADVLILLGSNGWMVVDDDEKWQPTPEGRAFCRWSPEKNGSQSLKWNVRTIEKALLGKSLSLISDNAQGQSPERMKRL